MTTHERARRWPLALLGLPAAVAIWSGWVGLGQMAGFGVVHPLPGIADEFELNTAIALPIGVEAYASLALGTWLSARPIPRTARRFAAWSSLAALGLGLLGQVVYHLLTAAGHTRAPTPVVVFVACLPVLVLGAGAALHHLLGDPTEPAETIGVNPATPATAVDGAEPTTRPAPGASDAHVSTPGEGVRPGLDGGGDHGVSRPSVGWDTAGCPTPGVQPVPSDAGQEPLPFAVNGTPDRRALPGGSDVGRDGGMRRALSPAVRARTVAELHAAHTGALPSVRELAELADVGRGTAARELAALREASNGLQLVSDDENEGPQQ